MVDRLLRHKLVELTSKFPIVFIAEGLEEEAGHLVQVDKRHVLAERRKNWKPREQRYRRGALRLFGEHAVSPMRGAYLAYED